jgi:deoxyhypusine synthase
MEQTILTQEHLRAGVRWIFRMSSSEKWNLTDAEVTKLLGLKHVDEVIVLRTAVENDIPIFITDETKERISLLLGIWKHLQLLAPAGRSSIMYNLFNSPNSGIFLQGKSIKDYLLTQNDASAFYDAKRYLASISQST